MMGNKIVAEQFRHGFGDEMFLIIPIHLEKGLIEYVTCVLAGSIIHFIKEWNIDTRI